MKFICLHDWKPAYWREAHPSYKRCYKCEEVKSGTKEEMIEWAKKSPWNETDLPVSQGSNRKTEKE